MSKNNVHIFINNNDTLSQLNPNLPLNKIPMPGSHDAGTYGINPTSKWNPYTDDTANWAN